MITEKASGKFYLAYISDPTDTRPFNGADNREVTMFAGTFGLYQNGITITGYIDNVLDIDELDRDKKGGEGYYMKIGQIGDVPVIQFMNDANN